MSKVSDLDQELPHRGERSVRGSASTPNRQVATMDARRMVNIAEQTPEQLIGPLTEVEKKNAPSRLFTAGRTELLRSGLRVSVVGSRDATREGLARTRALAEALAKSQVVVVSGLAEGIDTQAHTTAIEVGGATIAVLGTPLDMCFPKENRALMDLIMEAHLAVSQFAVGVPTQRKNFVMRNRTMALLSDATIIVEAGEGSGTIHQGWEALRLGRPLFLLESLATRSDISWPAEMRRYGAEILTKERLALVLENLPGRTRGELAF
jgi:DNA processing protein